MTFPLTITNDGMASNFFWAHQFFFDQGDGGYFGFQNRGDWRVHAINFSIWKAVGWLPQFPGNCRHFSHEGSGVQCDMIVNWIPYHVYEFRIIKNQHFITADFVDTTSNIVIRLATITVPYHWGTIANSISFVEEFTAQLIDCNRIGFTNAIFRRPYNNFNDFAYIRSYIYGRCGQSRFVTNECTIDNCIITTHS
jgi:hypothetical protein